MLFHLEIKVGALLAAALCIWLLATNSYKRLEKWIIGFVSLIGISFLFELTFPHIRWGTAIVCTFVPYAPKGSLMLILAVLGAVVMPHNLFLHSEIINNKEWNLEGKDKVVRELHFSFMDTLFSMIVGWAINCAIIILLLPHFFNRHIVVNRIQQSVAMLKPIIRKYFSCCFCHCIIICRYCFNNNSRHCWRKYFCGIF